ncbi:MAG: aldo/keto reductase [Candidatus Sericytochromatia bacterium]
MQESLFKAGSVSLGDISVRRIGLGSNRLTDTPENAKLLREAIALGINFIDTADVYTFGASEETLGRHLTPYPEDLVIATKGGVVRGQPPDGSPAYLRQAVDASLRRLRAEHLALYQLHRPDARIPIEESVGCLKELQAAGKIRRIGLSNVSVEQLESCRKIAPIVSIQNEYSLAQREQDPMIAYCEREGIAFLPYFPLAAGSKQDLLKQIATRHQATVTQVTLAWLLSRSPVMLPIPGTLSIAHLRENVAAGALVLDPRELTALTEA